MLRLWKRLWNEDRGQNLSEVALLLLLVSLFAASIAGTYGITVSGAYSKVYVAVTNVSSSGSGSSATADNSTSSNSRAGLSGGSGASNTSSSGNGHWNSNRHGQGLALGHN